MPRRHVHVEHRASTSFAVAPKHTVCSYPLALLIAEHTVDCSESSTSAPAPIGTPDPWNWHIRLQRLSRSRVNPQGRPRSASGDTYCYPMQIPSSVHEE